MQRTSLVQMQLTLGKDHFVRVQINLHLLPIIHVIVLILQSYPRRQRLILPNRCITWRVENRLFGGSNRSCRRCGRRNRVTFFDYRGGGCCCCGHRWHCGGCRSFIDRRHRSGWRFHIRLRHNQWQTCVLMLEVSDVSGQKNRLTGYKWSDLVFWSAQEPTKREKKINKNLNKKNW